MLSYFWRKLNTAKKPTKPRSKKLCLELLEDRCLPSTSIVEYPVSTASAAPTGITAGPDGNVWFTEAQASQIGMINASTHAVSEFATPTASSAPTGITAGPDGNLWFTEASANQIGMINPITDAVSEFAIPTSNSNPTGITAGPDGDLWFTETNGNKIGMINPTTHVITEYALPTSKSSPLSITAGPDGNLWFTESTNSKIGTISPVTHAITEYATPSAGSQPNGIVTGSDGNIWFTEKATNRVVQVNLATHGMIEIPVPTASSGPTSIAAGPNGSLWFIESKKNIIGQVILSSNGAGVVTNLGIAEVAIPTSSSTPTAITAGPGGAVWFTEAAGNQIGEIVASPIVTSTPVNTTVVEGETATFVAAAGVGLPPPSVQWMVSTNGGISYTPVINGAIINGGIYSGATTGTLTITDPTMTMTGYEYEAVFTNGISPAATTAPATLTVNNVLSVMPAAPAQGTIGTNYNQTISVVGSTSEFTLFAVNNFNGGGTGLTYADVTANPLNGTITITGTPTGAGTATFTVAVANTLGNSLTQNVAVTISGPLSIGTTSLPPTTAGMNYSQTINILGGAAMPYTTFAVTNFNPGSTGLTPAAITTLPALGQFNITGTATAGGTVTFTVIVTDSAGTTVTRNFTINVNPPLAITATLPEGAAGAHYHQVLTVTGGGVPYTSLTVANFSGGTTGLVAGNIAANMAAGTITIDGTPTAAGTFTLTVNAVDALGAVLTKTYTVTVAPGLTITQSLPQGTAAALYQQKITVSGGATPYTTFTVTGFGAGGTGLTASALTPNAATGIITISGTATAGGTVGFTVNVIDSAGSTLTKTFSLLINPPLTLSSPTVTQETLGLASFPGTLTIGGGTGPITLASYVGLPTGLVASVTGNTVSFVGTPKAAGTFLGGVAVKDAAGALTIRNFTITINAAPTISALSATQWTIGQAGFNGVMTAAGGTGGLSIVTSSGLPKGMLLGLKGSTLSFTGTPTAAGTFAGSVTLRDALGTIVTRTFSITINPTASVGNLTATQWTVGKGNFTGVMTISAGTAPFSITSASGLPAGMTASVTGNTIHFAGTPTTAGTFAGTIILHDAAGASISKTFTITINPPVQITTTALPSSMMAALYSADLKVAGGTGAYSFAVTAGALPPGMKISNTGVITGVTHGFGSFTFTITATDSVGASFSKTLSIAIAR